MRIKHIYPLALVAALILVGAAAFALLPGTSTPTSAAVVPDTSATTFAPAPQGPANEPTSSGTTVTPTPAPTPTPTQAPDTYTMAQVATHNSQQSCWTVVNGGVYDLTSFIFQHPGGPGAILSLCGTDGTQAFEAQHGTSRRPNNELATLKIGTLVQ